MDPRTFPKPDRTSQLERDFFLQDDVTGIAEYLVGCVLVSELDNRQTAGLIVETEAYCHRGDKACHAHGDTRTQRTETMYRRGGLAYVYLCYGIHHLFNVVTNRAEYPDAVLVRAIAPIYGLTTIQQRRNMNHQKPALTAGPGRLTQALGIITDYNGTDLCATHSSIWVQDRPEDLDIPIDRGTRVGIDYAGEDAQLPWRFGWENHPCISKTI